MKHRTFFVDENLPPDLAEPLCRVYRHHRFSTAKRWHLLSTDDVVLFDDLGARGCGAIITMDFNQLEEQDERDSLRKNGLHWIGVPHTGASGALLLAVLTAITVPGVHHVLSAWADEPHAYFLPRGDHGGPPDSERL